MPFCSLNICYIIPLSSGSLFLSSPWRVSPYLPFLYMSCPVAKRHFTKGTLWDDRSEKKGFNYSPMEGKLHSLFQCLSLDSVSPPSAMVTNMTSTKYKVDFAEDLNRQNNPSTPVLHCGPFHQTGLSPPQPPPNPPSQSSFATPSALMHISDVK